MDTYQQRYTAHQQRKKGQLLRLMQARYSERLFSDKEIEPEKLEKIFEMIQLAPSSCDRKAVHVVEIKDRDDKAFLGGVLVGGVGWIHRANRILLLFGDRFAYKENLFYMPYLDAGFVANQVYLTCGELDLSCCFVNPNIRNVHYPFFDQMFQKEQDWVFCGAMAIGYKNED